MTSRCRRDDVWRFQSSSRHSLRSSVALASLGFSHGERRAVHSLAKTLSQNAMSTPNTGKPPTASSSPASLSSKGGAMNSKPGSISASTIPGTDEHAIAQAIDSLARKQRRGLFWDFRLWLSMGAFLSTVIVGVCVWAILSDSADTKGALAAAKAQLAVVDDVNECRSAAAVWEAGVAAQRDNLVAEGLAGVGRGQSIAGLADALDVARANATTALLARKAAVDVRCASDPSYRISDSILQPLPPPGD